MYRIKTLNKISPAGLSVLDQTRYTISTDVENEDGILVRSADMHDYASPSTAAPRRASWYSIPPAPTPMR